ncbi:hypothetical protein DH2020_023943 [Rehmannia glutinosa]|uniref:Indole-3-acetic acid-amido synthetase n=1 Tax=Rehmannia glutinosa TaxID=99300 RepID=A0ABR0WBV2_REHGL
MAANSNDAEALQFIEEMSRNADAVQKNVLAKILTQNAETEYLKGFNLNGATDQETFKSKIPIVTYDDLQPLIRRMADGDSSPILTAHPVSEFIVRYAQGLDKGKVLQFLFTKPETKTKGGIPVRSSLTSLFKSDIFKNRSDNPDDVMVSPNEAVHCVDSFQSMYTQMLCGLYERENVTAVGAMFASGLLMAIRFLQVNWQQLTHDIRTGSFNPKVTDTSVRECMTRFTRLDPNLADAIAQECEKDNWEGIITRIWPNTKYIGTVVTGSMAQYIPTLDYYSGGLPIVSMMYASSECYFGLNINPMCKPSEVSYTLMPFLAYFEFLPHEPNSPGLKPPQLVDLVDVEIGKEYELVVTTNSGLYRYQIGDVLRVTGFRNKLPQFEFIRRKNVLLTIDSDKTREPELQVAVKNASQLLREFNTSVVEYTSYADTKIIPGHYVIYWELMEKDPTKSPSDEVLSQCCLTMEESFDQQYRRCRVVDKSIGPLEIRVVKNGTFQELMDYAVSKGASINQYKVPRCVTSKPMIDLLDSRVVSTHFSPSLPHWTSERRL